MVRFASLILAMLQLPGKGSDLNYLPLCHAFSNVPIYIHAHH